MGGEEIHHHIVRKRILALSQSLLELLHASPEIHSFAEIEAQPRHQFTSNMIGLQLHLSGGRHLEQPSHKKITKTRDSSRGIQKRRKDHVNRLRAQLLQRVMSQLVGKFMRQNCGESILILADWKNRRKDEDLTIRKNECIGRLARRIGSIDYMNGPIERLEMGYLSWILGAVNGTGQQAIHDSGDLRIVRVRLRNDSVLVLSEKLGIRVISNLGLQPIGNPQKTMSACEGGCVEIINIESYGTRYKISKISVSEKRPYVELWFGVVEAPIRSIIANRLWLDEGL